MKPYIWLVINGAVLTVCAVFIYDYRQTVLIAGMLFLPLLDKNWQLDKPRSLLATSDRATTISLAIGCLAIIALHLDEPALVLTTVVFTALPEEWFFRAYLLVQTSKYIGTGKANVASSVIFTLLHLPTQGVTGLLVIIPSLVFGYIYLRYRSLGLVILLHAASNLIYTSYLSLWIKQL